MGFLYVNYEGNEKSRHSYSAGQEFDDNPRKYWLRRLQGWSERDMKASLLFGRALEDAIQFYHDNNGKGGIEEFERLWIVNQSKDALVYTMRERDWASLNRAGREMMMLYAIRQPSLPMPLATRFQREFTREVYPGDERLGGIEFFGKLDAIPRVDPHHPLLTKIEWKEEYGLYRQVITDIKTAGTDFDVMPGQVAQDLQLRMYSWLTGFRDVAFLWFKKNLHELQKGTSITLLKDAGSFKAGDEAVVAYTNEEEGTWIVKDDFVMEEMKKYVGDKPTTKEGKAKRMEFLQNVATVCTPDVLTRQRLQYSSGFVSIEKAEDAGHIIGNQISNIVAARERNIWVDKFGVRFPHDNRKDPFYRAFNLNDEEFRKTMFEKKGEEPMDDFGEAATEEQS